MSAKVEHLEDGKVKIELELPVDKLKAAEIDAFTKLKHAGRLRLDGFRAKKVTLDMVKRLYGKLVFLEEAVSGVAGDLYGDVIREEGLVPVGDPKMDIVEETPSLDEPVHVTITVDILKDPELGEYKGVKAPMGDTTVTEDEVSQYIGREQERNARLVTIEDRAAEMGDVVTLDFVGTLDGVAFEGGTANDHQLELGSHSFIPGFEEGLVGVNAGEEKDVTVTFPENYTKELAGKEAVFHCRIKAVQRKDLPELDDEFAQDVSECDTFEQYMEMVRGQLTEQKEKNARSSFENAAVAKAIANATLDIPDSLVRERADRDFAIMERQIKGSHMTMDDYAAANGMDTNTLRLLMRLQAENEIREEEILLAIAKAEDITCSEADLNARLIAEAGRLGMDVAEFEKTYPYARATIREELVKEAARKVIIDNAVVGEDEPEEAPAEEGGEE